MKKKMKSKSHFYKYFSSYLVILIAPLLTIVLLFGHSQELVKEQIQIANNNTLNQFFERIDEMVKNAHDICVTIANNQKCMQYPRYAAERPGKTTFETWEISKVLYEYTGEPYYDIFIYYPIDNRIISGRNASSTLDVYYELFYEREDDFREEFREVAECTSGKPIICSMNGKGVESYLCVAMRQGNLKKENNSYVVVAVFERDYISDILRSVENNNKTGVSLIYNDKKEAIFSTDVRLLSYNLEEGKDTDSTFEKKIDGEKFVLQMRASEVINAYYTYAVPRNYYWGKLYSLYIICGIGALISIVVGTLLAKEEAKRVYRPIDLLINNLQKLVGTDYDDKAKTEFEFIELLFDKELKEKIVMNNTLRQGQVIKRENFIYSLLNGTYENLVDDSVDVFDKNGISLCSDYFCVMVLEVETNGIVQNDMKFFVLSNVFEELVNREYQGYMVSIQSDRYAILVNVQKESDRTQLIAVVKEGQGFLKKYCKIGMSLGVSSVQEGMLGIRAAYEEACFALRYKYLMGEESIIDYYKVSGRNFEYIPASESKLLFKVSDYLFGDSQKVSAQDLVDDIMFSYGINRESSMETVECFEFETVSTLNRVMTQGGYWMEPWKSMVQALLVSATLNEFKIKLSELLAELNRKQQEKVGEKDVCVRAFEYIEGHYNEAQLSLTELGELLDVSPSYLSKLFKEKYQISIPDFITLTRINAAKVQLRSTKYSIVKIAENNGFLSSSVFIKTFKKMEGITPGIYREFHEKNEGVDKK